MGAATAQCAICDRTRMEHQLGDQHPFGHPSTAGHEFVTRGEAKRRAAAEAAPAPFPERPGWLVLDGWMGILRTPVVVVGETPKRYRIRATSTTRLPGRMRYLGAGDTALVPKHAISFKEE